MKKCLFLITTLLLTACVAKRGIISLPENITYNAEFKILWADFAEETKNKRSLKNYTPSDKLIQNHNLTKQDGEVIVSGFLFTAEDFSIQDFENIKGSLVNYGKGTFTFRIPIKNIDKMVKIKGINRIETTKNANLKINKI